MGHQLYPIHIVEALTFALDALEWISGETPTRIFPLEDKNDLLATWAWLQGGQRGWQRLKGF